MRIFTEEEDRRLRDATIRTIDGQHLTGKAAEEYAERTQMELIRNYDARMGAQSTDGGMING